ncbi:MAG: hypothetical protein NTV34_07120 [Proteobacteria bacterium]|nr:hypothetical protein [Pseudomonadota bacterium]
MMITITNEDLSRLVRIISDLTGNNVQERNHPMVRSRMINRISKLGLASMEDYWTFYEDNAIDERAALQGLMTTHHTFFFREYAHFEALESWINENSLRLKKRFNATKAPLRVWSAACSRGQEVYSLAMFLEFILVQRHGIPYKILGTDIDAASVDFARNGVYPIKEVNTIPTQYLSGYWKRGTGSIKEFAAAHPRLRENTEFTTMNLLAIKTAAVKFDVIFARNVFIYFTEENVQKIALGLKENMADHGFFASGLSEPLRFDGWDLPSPSPSCYVKIPVDQKMQSQASISPTATPSSLTTMPESLLYKVLCVDDSPTIQSIMQKIFSSDPNCSGVVSAFNGIESSTQINST